MDTGKLKNLLQKVKEGEINVDDAMKKLKILPFEDIGFAKVDHHRKLRQGYPEVIYCPGKTLKQISKIVSSLLKTGNNIMATKASREVYECILKISKKAVYHEDAKIVQINKNKNTKTKNVIAVVSAGTADMPVSEEAAVTAEILGNKVQRIYDVGVAGIHRLFENAELLMNANVLIVVAGMEGALASVVGGFVDRPVIAVPTSVGYGASFGGISALLTMLNSCASGVCVVNIDNGFGAGYLASLINKIN